MLQLTRSARVLAGTDFDDEDSVGSGSTTGETKVHRGVIILSESSSSVSPLSLGRIRCVQQNQCSQLQVHFLRKEDKARSFQRVFRLPGDARAAMIKKYAKLRRKGGLVAGRTAAANWRRGQA